MKILLLVHLNGREILRTTDIKNGKHGYGRDEERRNELEINLKKKWAPKLEAARQLVADQEGTFKNCGSRVSQVVSMVASVIPHPFAAIGRGFRTAAIGKLDKLYGEQYAIIEARGAGSTIAFYVKQKAARCGR